MFNKLYEWIGTGFASLRNDVPASERHQRADRKRRFSCVEDGDEADPGDGADPRDETVKRSRMEDLVDTVKTAAEGVKTQGWSVASWVRSNVMNASMSSSPPSGSDFIQTASHAAQTPPLSSVRTGNALEKTSDTLGIFLAPSTSLEWRLPSKSDLMKTEKSAANTEVARRASFIPHPHHRAPKTNGHNIGLPPPSTPKSCQCPRLGRPVSVGSHRPVSNGLGNASFTSMYEKTFPIRVVQSPSPSRSPGFQRRRSTCTAVESVRKEEKEVYRQLLNMVSGSTNAFFQDGSSYTGLHSHRDFSSFLSTSRHLLPCAYPADVGEPGASDPPSGPRSPQQVSSLCSSNVPSPREDSYEGSQISDTEPASPLAALQDNSSQDTQTSAHDGDSVIFVKQQQGKNQETSSMPYFQAELWIKELTSLYDSRARERRRQIEEQEALTAQLLRQRLTEERRVRQDGVELQVRVPLEREVPLAPVVDVVKPGEEEFPMLTEAMEGEVNRAFKGGSLDEVLSEGFRLTIKRKDIQTLSNLNWLNDEVINFYMNLLVERSRNPGLPSVYTFNTFFYPKLRTSGYTAVRRWTKKVDIFSSDILLVPIHLGVHWCLSVVDFRKKIVTYLDSMGGVNDEACQLLLNYLQQESLDKKDKEMDTSQWVLHSKKRNEIPQQMNGSDCGMFTCKYAEYITKDKPITFTQKHMPYFRRRMVWEILNRKLL